MRRFLTGKNETYENFYDRFFAQSNILHEGGMPTAFSKNLSDKEGINQELLAKFGIQDEQDPHFEEFYDDNYQEWTSSTALRLKTQQKELDIKFKNFCQQKINTGYEKPKKMPPEFYEKQMRIFAEKDVLAEEVKFLQKRLKRLAEQNGKINSQKILQYGLRGAGKIKNNILVVLDGQNISIAQPEEILFIDDKRSPYNGMAVVDYRKLSIEWRKEKIRLEDEALEKIKKSVNPSEIKRHFFPKFPEYPKDWKHYTKEVKFTRKTNETKKEETEDE